MFALGLTETNTFLDETSLNGLVLDHGVRYDELEVLGMRHDLELVLDLCLNLALEGSEVDHRSLHLDFGLVRAVLAPSGLGWEESLELGVPMGSSANL